MAYNFFSAGNTGLFGTNADKVFGKTPIVPTLPTLTEAQKTAVAANRANFADIAANAAQVNTFNQDQLNALIDRTLGPGARQQIQENIASGLRGELPQDVMDSIYRSRAGRNAAGNAFGGDYSAGGFGGKGIFRDIVGTSYDITQQNLKSAESWLAQAKAPSFDVTRMFVTPLDQEKANLDQFNRDWLAAKVAAAPDPGVRGVFDTGWGVIGMAAGILGSGNGGIGSHPYQADYGGGLGGGAGGGGGMYTPQGYSPAYGAPYPQDYTPAYNSNGMYPSGGGGGEGGGGGFGGLSMIA